MPHLQGFQAGKLCKVYEAGALGRQVASRQRLCQLLPWHHCRYLAWQLFQSNIMPLHIDARNHCTWFWLSMITRLAYLDFLAHQRKRAFGRSSGESLLMPHAP